MRDFFFPYSVVRRALIHTIGMEAMSFGWLTDRREQVISQNGSLKLIYWLKSIYLCLCPMVKNMNTYGKTGISSLHLRCKKCITFTGNSL